MNPPAALQRRLGLALLVLYGTGITVGAGIYVLIGAVAGHAGAFTPWSFLLAAAVMALTVASYTELSTRFPVSAGEAAYVRAAFGSRALSTATGLLTILIAVVSSSAVALGAAGYLKQFVDLPQGVLVVLIVCALGGVAALGILQSVAVAGFFTIIEVGGLLAIIVAALNAGLVPQMPSRSPSTLPSSPASPSAACWRSSPSSASRTLPMSWRRRGIRIGIFRVRWC